jgi:hypothetical protein
MGESKSGWFSGTFLIRDSGLDLHGLAEVLGLQRGSAADVADKLGVLGELRRPIHIALGYDGTQVVLMAGMVFMQLVLGRYSFRHIISSFMGR